MTREPRRNLTPWGVWRVTIPSRMKDLPQRDLTPVAAAVIQQQGRYLLCRRPAHKHHGNLWEFPGGKLAKDESAADALARELEEELALSVREVGEVLCCIRDAAAGVEVSFYPVGVAGEPMLLEHSALTWADLSNLPASMELAPSDRQFVLHLVGGPTRV
jgi:8-oxo-dGTP diphosphatase